MKKIKLHLVVLLILLISAISFKTQAQAFYYTAVNSSNVAGTYTDLGSNGTVITTPDYDESLSNPENIGFNFSFNGNIFTQFILSTNGFIKLGAIAPSGSLPGTAGPQDCGGSALQSADPLDINIISPFNIDLDSAKNAGGTVITEYRVFTTGAPGAQTCTIQWKNVNEYNLGGGFIQQAKNFSFQVILYEGSNKIEFVYGTMKSGTSTQFHTAGCGIKAASNATAQILLAKKGSATAWASSTFSNLWTGAPPTYQCLSFRQAIPPVSGKTFRFLSAAPNDLSITNIYTLGSLASGYSDPHVLSVRIQNVGLNAMAASTVTLDVSGSNLFNNVQVVPALIAGASTVVNFPAYSSPVQGTNNILVTIPADDVSGNNTSSMTQAVTANLTSYKYNAPFTGGVGFTAPSEGVFVAQFQSGNKYGNSDTLNEVKVDFQAAAASRIIRLAIYADSVGLPGTPSRTALYMSAPITVTAAAQQSTITIPNIVVPTIYYAGLLQTAASTVNMAFSYQAETPIRSTSFFFSLAVPVASWINFAPNNAFRIAVEVRYNIPLPPSCVINHSPVDLEPSLCYKSLLSWAANGGAPTGYDVYLSTVQADVDNSVIGAKVSSNQPGLTFDPTGLVTGNTTYYWKVVAKNTAGDASGCATLSFTTAPSPSLPFTESFTSITFPPTCWDATSIVAIDRAPESAYGVGSGSTIFDFYNNGPGNFDFTTPSFGNTPAGHVLSFDYAYATFQTEVDQLELFYSTDDGTNFTSLVLLNGGLNGILNTGGANTNAFIPTASQWAKYQIVLPTGTNKIRFRGISVFGNNLYIDNVSVDVPPPAPSCAINLLPADLATNQFRDVTLTWAFGPGAVPSGYDVYLDQNISPTTLVSANQAGSSYTASGLLANAQYYWKIVPKNISGDAIGCTIQSFTTGQLYNYCTPTHSVICGVGSITNVKLRYTLDNTTTCSAPGYQSYPASGATTTSLPRGQNHFVSVTTSSSAIVSVWIDFDQNGIFDTYEWTQVTTASTANVANVATVNFPLTAALGQTKMRIRSRGALNPNSNLDACTSFGSGESEDYIITILPEAVVAPACAATISAGNIACVTQTTLNWTDGGGFPEGYHVSLATDIGMNNLILFQADAGNALSYTLPALQPNTPYYYQVAGYVGLLENLACAVGTFTSGPSQAVTPAVATNILPAVNWNFGAEGVTPPALNCGITVENYDQLGTSNWYTSSIAPRSGSNHMRIDKNPDNTNALDDYFFTVPINVTAGKVYRITWWDRASSASFTENYEVRMASLPDGSTMSGSAPDLFSTNSTTYAQKQATDYLVPINGSGTVYFGFHAISGAAKGSIYIDDIVVSEVPVPQLNPIYCTTIPSMYDQIFVTPIPGATNYRFKIVGTGGQAGYNFEHYRNNSNPDYRLKWAPGVIYGYTYNVQVASFKNGVWSPYGPSCPVSLGAFPQIKLRNNPATIAGPCDYVITDLNDRILTDSLSGANDYMYRIVEDVPGGAYDYDHTWQRYSGNLDFRLLWAFQSSPLIDRVRFGYSYDVQTRALVGKTGVTYGNRPGEWGTYGSTCKVDLTAASPTTTLTNCNISLTSLNDQFFIGGVTGAINYEYEFSAPGFTTATVYRGNGNLDFRMVWLAGVKYATTFSVRVRAYVGGVWLNYGTPCTVITPAAPSTSVLGICGTTLSPGQFSSTIFCTAVPGASLYSYRITNVGGVPYSKVVYNYNSNNSFSLSRTLVCCGYQNMLPNATYTIEVAYYAGEWSAYGPVCTFTTGATVPRYSPFASEGVEAVEGALNLSVYPNPATVNQQFALELQGITAANEKVQVRIFNMIGDKVYSAEVITKEEAILTIKPEMQLAAGVYMAEAQLNGNVYRVKFVVK
ncbi:MAG: T9SS type A sorting domain-containing protein [Bacteroidetes bacterium]|nr:T9SS type A sorting domain-containing protein [Bacteroidota bacterium]